MLEQFPNTPRPKTIRGASIRRVDRVGDAVRCSQQSAYDFGSPSTWVSKFLGKCKLEKTLATDQAPTTQRPINSPGPRLLIQRPAQTIHPITFAGPLSTKNRTKNSPSRQQEGQTRGSVWGGPAEVGPRLRVRETRPVGGRFEGGALHPPYYRHTGRLSPNQGRPSCACGKRAILLTCVAITLRKSARACCV